MCLRVNYKFFRNDLFFNFLNKLSRFHYPGNLSPICSKKYKNKRYVQEVLIKCNCSVKHREGRDGSWRVLGGTAFRGNKTKLMFKQDIVNILEGNIEINHKMQLKMGVQ